MQHLIFNLESTDDSDGMKEELKREPLEKFKWSSIQCS